MAQRYQGRRLSADLLTTVDETRARGMTTGKRYAALILDRGNN